MGAIAYGFVMSDEVNFLTFILFFFIFLFFLFLFFYFLCGSIKGTFYFWADPQVKVVSNMSIIVDGYLTRGLFRP